MTSFNPQEILVIAHGRGWISLHQFSIVIGVSYPTACRMRDRGEVAVTKVGGIFRITTVELKRFMQEGNNPTTAVLDLEGEQSSSL